MIPASVRHWIFDLDGTLTKPVHDFAEIRRMLGLNDDPEHGILEQLAEMPEDERAPLVETLNVHEYELACAAEPSDGAAALLDALSKQDVRVAIVTRNNLRNVEATLAATGLDAYFAPQSVVTRETGVAPKPRPDGILWLLERWDVGPDDAVMIGNHMIDVTAGRAAGTLTVQIDQQARFEWGWPAHYHVRSLRELIFW
jgi:HAD superfamily hydrolase (TIGR01509 family)